MSPKYNGFFRANPITKSAQAASWRGIKMPIDILLGLPGYVTNQARFPSIAFNLAGALSILLQNHAEIASKMLVPYVWAPGLGNASLAAFAESAVNGRLEPFIYKAKRLRVAQFPGQVKQPIRRKDYEIIHFCGKVTPQSELLLDEQGTGRLSLESLSKALSASRTRLLIFDAVDQESFDNAASLASLAESLGLAILRVYARSSAARDEYLMNIYANLVHNRQLVEMTTPGYWYENELQIELTYPEDSQDCLNFDRWMAALEKRLVRAESRVERISKMEEKIQSYSPVLHTTQSKRLLRENIREAIDNSSEQLRESLDTLRSIRHTTWDHERDGAVFLPAMAEAARMVDHDTLEAELSLPQSGAIEEEIRNAPRVINTNFAEDSGRVIPLDESLQAGATYDLLVDIGPRWNRFPSLLGENAEFPEEAIGELVSEEEKQQGWFDVEAVFVSEQFSPNLVSARMRVPLLAIGRSIPYKGQGQELADRPGPVHLRVSAPQTANKKETLRAHGRLCLYYGAQVIQSAVLDIGVQRQPGQVQETLNSGLVDYVLTPGFRAVEETIATRRLSENGEAVPVKVGLMLNDDLSGSHRLLLKMHDSQAETASLPPAWKSYDATMIQSVLERARSILVNPAGQSLASYNSETFLLDKFKDDLSALGKLGAELYSILLQGITPGGSLSPLAWRKKFRSALQPGDVIQLARAGSVPSTHIIPWALVYEIPIEPGHSEKPFKICRVVDEQWDKVTATRKQSQGFAACPYEHEHETNVICPFGFWGYKYTLEQPLSALHSKGWDIEPARRVLADIPIKMAVAATEDVPRKSRYQAHFESIRQAVSAEYLPSGLARERDEFRDSLRAPQIVYILCHGGKDGKVTTLSIGPRDKDAKHTITPDLPGNWGEHDYIDLEKWEETRPLVFINGCYTTDLLPELTLDFVSAFRDLMVGGVIGTEIEVTVEFGYQAAERFFEHLGRGAGVGQAILSMRWDLLNQGSFIGLAYTPYAMSDMHLERSSSATHSPAIPAAPISNNR